MDEPDDDIELGYVDGECDLLDFELGTLLLDFAFGVCPAGECDGFDTGLEDGLEFLPDLEELDDAVGLGYVDGECDLLDFELGTLLLVFEFGLYLIGDCDGFDTGRIVGTKLLLDFEEPDDGGRLGYEDGESDLLDFELELLPDFAECGGYEGLECTVGGLDLLDFDGEGAELFPDFPIVLGVIVGEKLGSIVGFRVTALSTGGKGDVLGDTLGLTVGLRLGLDDGSALGLEEDGGLDDGGVVLIGLSVGLFDGELLGEELGSGDGDSLGLKVGP